MCTSPFGRPRTLDRNKKTLFCDAVSRGASMTEAALTVGVSLRTVQREARLDPHFDQELRLAHTDKPDPLAIMQSAARTHWRAAAWLLERTKPEDYGRRPASSCSPYQFGEALKVVIDAALQLAPPENHAQVYAELTAASETAFKAVFPNYGPYGRHLVKRLPDTPLANAQRLEVLRNPPPNRIVPDRIEPDPLQPRALPGGNCRVGALHPPSPRPAHGDFQRDDPTPEPTNTAASAELKIPEPSPTPTTPTALSECATPPLVPSLKYLPIDAPPANDELTPSPSAPEGRRSVATGASPWTQRPNKLKPQRGGMTPASKPSKIRSRSARALRPVASRTAPASRQGRRLLSPKTRFASKLNAAHLAAATAPQCAPVSRTNQASSIQHRASPRPSRR